MFKVPSKIFSIGDYKGTHHQIYFCGVRVRIMKSSIKAKKQQSPYAEYKKNNVDITTLPPATGQIRDVQLSNLELLKELDYVCKKNNLQYWLDFGTLIGAIRHKGFIPWDDDIDTGMMISDHDKLLEVFDRDKRNPDVYITRFYYPYSNMNRWLIRIKHKKNDHLFVDVFPYYSYGKCLDVSEQVRLTKEMREYRKKYMAEHKPKTEKDIYYYNKIIQENLITAPQNIEGDTSDLIWGTEFCHSWHNWIHPRNWIFPLRECDFEGLKMPCPNKYDEYLRDVYGDYMSYPKKIGIGHNMYKTFTNEEIAVIKDLIGE